MNNVIKADPFWDDVIAAYEQVQINPNLQIKIDRGGRYAVVSATQHSGIVVITISHSDIPITYERV